MKRFQLEGMELPPGFRGYGKDLTEHHPDTKTRQEIVKVIQEKLEAEGANRFEIQYLDAVFR